MRLEIDPQLRCRAEVPGEPERGVGGDRAAAEDDVVDPRARHLDRLCECVNANPHRLEEIVAQDLAGMSR